MQVFRGISVVTFQHDTERIADIKTETTKTSVTEDQLVLGRFKTLCRNAGKTAEVQLNNPTQIKAQHQARRDREIRLFSACHTAMTEICSKLEATIQMGSSQVRHRDIAGDNSSDSRAITALYSDQFGSRFIRYGGRSRTHGQEKNGRKGSKEESQCLIHRD